MNAPVPAFDRDVVESLDDLHRAIIEVMVSRKRARIIEPDGVKPV